MLARVPFVLPFLMVPCVVACSSGSSGGGGGGDGEAALAALGFTPGDVADMATGTMAVSLDWLANDGVVPTARFGGSCPSVTVGPDDDSSGHPDSLTITFDCVTLEGLVISGSLTLLEYSDPGDFLADQCGSLYSGSSPDWGMSGSFFLTIQESGSASFGMNGSIAFAEFPTLGLLAMEIHTSVVGYPVDGGTTYLVDTNVCCTLPTDDSSDIPVGFVETFVHDPAIALAVLSLECELLPNGTVAFEAFAGSDEVASGIINLAAEDGDEVTFD
jgi:hypothetical protein